ncbi:hypothetical protein LINPERPRIM_LOCUS13671 [Linum perenne]
MPHRFRSKGYSWNPPPQQQQQQQTPCTLNLGAMTRSPNRRDQTTLELMSTRFLAVQTPSPTSCKRVRYDRMPFIESSELAGFTSKFMLS